MAKLRDNACDPMILMKMLFKWLNTHVSATVDKKKKPRNSKSRVNCKPKPHLKV